MKKCPYCFTELDDRASICSGCRKRVFKKSSDGVAKKQSGCFTTAILIIAIMTVLMIFGSIFLKSSEQPTQTDDLAYKKSVKDSLKRLKSKHKGDIRKTDLMVLTPKDIFNIQKQLKGLGYNIGTVDGRLGENTEKAIKQFQLNKRLPASGNINKETKEKLEFAWKKKICDHTTIADDISGLTGRSLDEGRNLVIKHFNITEDQFKQINVEGLKEHWDLPEISEKEKPEYKYLLID